MMRAFWPSQGFKGAMKAFVRGPSFLGKTPVGVISSTPLAKLIV
jgi:hypothetical protein